MYFYQYLIYDNDEADCYHESGRLEDFSQLYKNRDNCVKDALERIDELNEEYETEDRFQYSIAELEVVDE